MYGFFWCWISFISPFVPTLPFQMPERAAKLNLFFCPMQYHPGFCSLLSSLFLWTYLESVFKVDVFGASEISLPASSQHKWNYIVKKYWFFIGDALEYGHYIEELALQAVVAHHLDLLWVQTLGCILWAGLCWNGLDPCGADVAHQEWKTSSCPLTSEWELPEFHLICKTSAEAIPLCMGTVLWAAENRRICIYRCVTLQLSFPLSMDDWWQTRWTGVFQPLLSCCNILCQWGLLAN